MESGGKNVQQKDPFLTSRPVLVALFFFVPILLPGLIGWLNGLLAVPVFLLLQTAADEEKAGLEIRNGLLMAGLGSLLLGRLLMFLFILAMLPLGYSLHMSAGQRKDPAQAGIAGIIALSLAWLIFWTMYGTIAGVNPYMGLLRDMDALMEHVIVGYRGNADLPVETLYALEQLIAGLRELLPRILPGILAGTVLLTVVLNMVISRALLVKLVPERNCWPSYSEWRLPDKAVWFFILAVVLLLLSKGEGSLGLNLVLIAGFIYFLQGFAVLVHTLNRWNLPRIFRLFIYVMLALQGYGVLLVALAGIADIWADFRKLGHEDTIE